MHVFFQEQSIVAVLSHLILSYQCMCSSKNNLWWQSLVSPYPILQMHVFFKEQSIVAVLSHLILSYQCMCSSKNNLKWQSCLTLSYLTNAYVLQRTIYGGSLVSPYLILPMHNVLPRTIYSGSLVSPYLILPMHVFFKEQSMVAVLSHLILSYKCMYSSKNNL